jgi:hypothetical protein
VDTNINSGNYWIVNQILSRNLQYADAESTAYTTALMEKLEKVMHTLPDSRWRGSWFTD